MESILTDREIRSLNIPETEWDYEQMEVVWGIPNGHSKKANTYDCELIYHKDTDTYTFDIDCGYGFNSTKEKVKYLRRLLKAFTKWMNDNGYNTSYIFPYYDLFADKMNADTSFKTIEACYANFKVLVTGYTTVATRAEEDKD